MPFDVVSYVLAKKYMKVLKLPGLQELATLLSKSDDELIAFFEECDNYDLLARLVDMLPVERAVKILDSISLQKTVAILTNHNVSSYKVARILLDVRLGLDKAYYIFSTITRDFKGSGYTVYDNWNDTELVFDAPSGAVVELDKPASGYKRVFESSNTFGYTPGFRVIPDGVLKTGRILFRGKIGAYHGYDATRATWKLIIFLPDKSQYVMININFADNGFANGSYDNYVVMAIQINPDNTVTVDADVNYSVETTDNPYSMVGNTVVVACAYSDAWDTDYNQWSSLDANAVVLR